MQPANLILASVFIIIWSSGFIIGRMIVGAVSPNIFLGLRFALSCLMFVLVAWVLKRAYPEARDWGKHFLVGMLSSGLYLGGGYWAISQGVSASLMALLGGLQPIFTLIIMLIFFKEKLAMSALFGMILGILGIYCVVSPSLGLGAEFSLAVFAIAVLSVLSITIGMVLQKQYIGTSDIIPSLALQNFAAMLTAAVLMLVMQEDLLVINSQSIFGLFWAVVVLSGVGVFLFIKLIKNIGAVKTTSFLLLAPPLAAIQAKLLFGETLSFIQMLGFVLALAGVWLCQKTTLRPISEPKK
ncbi:DMT family transporter [Moraxella sp. FZLJ2107]|uniref:DMT family transporter n=1 Tax=unclassified Moraxella TaxID=2685852 RepID=UPI0020C928CA|nr:MULTISPECIES: DMT family transporter [unclassified Moraxella]UTO04414.1 DMT family transporter [Moraxella sp. FZLJ2107]UTO23247.1 DMT family transporter [Moraxella sp. FZLJ2109]